MNESILNECQPEKNEIMKQITEGNAEYIFNGFCRIENGVMILSYSFFKCFATEQTYDILTQILVKKLETLLSDIGHFVIYLNMDRCSINQLNKHHKYFTSLSLMFQDMYPDKLQKCYLFNTSKSITNIYSVINMFVDKDTFSKIEIVYKE